MLPVMGVALLSLGLMACVAPDTTPMPARADEPTATPPREFPDHLVDIVENERFQLWRNKVAAAGLAPVIGHWGLSTAKVRDDEDLDPLAIRMTPLFGTVSERIPSIDSIPAGKSFNFRRTLEVWDRVQRVVRDRLGVRPEGDLAALRYQWKDYIFTPPARIIPDVPIEYWLWEEPRVMKRTNMLRLEQGLPLAS